MTIFSSLAGYLLQASMKNWMSAFISWVSVRRSVSRYQLLDENSDDDLLLENFMATRRCRRRGAVTQVLAEDARFIREMLRYMIMWKHLQMYGFVDIDIRERVSKDVPMAYSQFFRVECKDSSLLCDEDLVTKFGLIGQAVSCS